MAPTVPAHLASNFRGLPSEGVLELESSLRRHYFTRRVWGHLDISPEAYLASEAGRYDLAAHMDVRLTEFREVLIPWFDAVCGLRDSRILEIGCGTGASTLALAEQGAVVTAIDVDGASMQVARDRLRLHGCEASFLEANATDIPMLLAGHAFDLVIFFATLEHLTHNERLAAMRGTWSLLQPGAHWAVVETPNRLWYFDDHTSHLPFYHWLPDDLALEYSRFSPRTPFNEAYSSSDELVSFLRQGRGVSYHEFDLALGDTSGLDVVSSLRSWLAAKNPLRRVVSRVRPTGRFTAFLRSVGPPIHPGFYDRDLYLIIRRA
jgi:S-adenosylmethionine-dependent methyltransferase